MIARRGTTPPRFSPLDGSTTTPRCGERGAEQPVYTKAIRSGTLPGRARHPHPVILFQPVEPRLGRERINKATLSASSPFR